MSEPIAYRGTGTRSVTAWGVCLIVLIAWAFRFPPIPHPPLGGDEATTANFVFANGVRAISSHYSTNTHLFYSLMGRLAYIVWGPVPLAIRLPALFAGILGFPALFVLGRRWLGERVGLLAALLLLFSQRHWNYSLHGRGYTTVILAAILAFYFFWRGWQHSRRRDWLLLILATVAAAYTHFFGIFPLVSQSVFALVDTLRRRRWRPFVFFTISAAISGTLLLILYLPILVTIIGNARDNPFQTAFTQNPANILLLFARIGPSPHTQPDIISGIFLAAFVLGVLDTLWRRRRMGLLIVLWLGVPLAYAFMARTYVHDRFLLFITGGYLLLVARGFLLIPDLVGRWIQRRSLRFPRPAASLVVSSLVIVILSFDATLGWLQPDSVAWNETWRFLSEQVEAEDVIIIMPATAGVSLLRWGIPAERRLGLGGILKPQRLCRFYDQPRRTWWVMMFSRAREMGDGFQVFPFRGITVVTTKESVATPDEAIQHTITLLDGLRQDWIHHTGLPHRDELMHRLYASLAEFQLSQRQVRGAIWTLTQATLTTNGVSKKDRAADYLGLGQAYLMAGEREKGEEAFRKARELGATEEQESYGRYMAAGSPNDEFCRRIFVGAMKWGSTNR